MSVLQRLGKKREGGGAQVSEVTDHICGAILVSPVRLGSRDELCGVSVDLLRDL
jgi:hypothetical protein